MINGHTLRDMIAAQGVEILDRGHSVSKGNFNIQCPFCGVADRGHHMGIRLYDGAWACWRNAEHRGRSPVRLMVAILGKPVYEVRRLLGIRSAPDLGAFARIKQRIEQGGAEDDEEDKRADVLKVPREFRSDWDSSSFAASRFVSYIESRGFTGSAMLGVVHAFGLMYAIKGDFADRVVMPYWYQGNMVTWTARTIHAGEGLRYRDLEKEKSVMHVDEMLYNYDGAAMGGRALVVLEGQVDVQKGDYAGRNMGVRCVGLGTNSITDAQMLQLIELSSGFEDVWIALDTPTEFAKMDGYRMVGRLRGAVDAKLLDTSHLGKDLGASSIRSICALFTRSVLCD